MSASVLTAHLLTLCAFFIFKTIPLCLCIFGQLHTRNSSVEHFLQLCSNGQHLASEPIHQKKKEKERKTRGGRQINTFYENVLLWNKCGTHVKHIYYTCETWLWINFMVMTWNLSCKAHISTCETYVITCGTQGILNGHFQHVKNLTV